jgi:hypothetical protein
MFVVGQIALIALMIFATNGGEWTIDRMLFGAAAAGSYIF